MIYVAVLLAYMIDWDAFTFSAVAIDETKVNVIDCFQHSCESYLLFTSVIYVNFLHLSLLDSQNKSEVYTITDLNGPMFERMQGQKY